MIDSLFKILGSALSLWESKEKRKYIDKLIKLKREYYAESNLERPDMAKLDNLVFELELFSSAVSAQIGEPDPVSKEG